ncbi:MAG: bifunctional DNA-formamidopyrimidine glycosylase/DNA-(apurinic or apyrimidinic site) lyase [Armatimonadetes bacterium]|nr:bifunctional DNA-formamidopyrimidine glycosylase/DNA-(apurinic or apyrimidinic site) lyase [Armatimonadota bacterium]
MPELPEVETVRRGLVPLCGSTITDCLVANAKVLRGQASDTFRNRLIGATVDAVDRRGKYLLVRLKQTDGSPEAFTIYIHLKMRGQIRLEPAHAEPGRYHCVTITTKNINGETRNLCFYDMWTWGEMRVFTESEAKKVMPSLFKMGAEPLTEDWTGAALELSLRGRRTAIKPTLLDQSVVAGVGNIYADEALHRAGIHPRRVAGQLSRAETDDLVASIKTILTEAIGTGGTTSDNFFDVTGGVGNYTPRVYERAGKPCRGCDTVLTGIRLAGRSAVFCPVCQPEPVSAEFSTGKPGVKAI